MQKARYGIDAPLIIFIFFIMGFVFLAATFLAQTHLTNTHKIASYVITIITAVSAGYCFLVGCLMILSSTFGKMKVLKSLIHSLRLTGNEQILDVGCGRGMLLIQAAKKLATGKATGIDIWRQEDQSNNKQAVTEHNAELEGVRDKVEIITSDMTNMHLVDNQFDVIISSMAIHNISQTIEREKALREIDRVLKPGGKIALLDFQKTDQYADFFKRMNYVEVVVSKKDYRMFPPVRVIIGVKRVS